MKSILLEGYVDGAYIRKGKKSSSAFVLIHKNQILCKQGAYVKNGTTVIAEMIAFKMLLKYLIDTNLHNNYIHVYTDSQLVYNTFTKWIHTWKKNNWVKRNGRPVSNVPLIQSIHQKMVKFPSLELHWIRGHAGNKYNEMAHNLCHEILS